MLSIIIYRVIGEWIMWICTIGLGGGGQLRLGLKAGLRLTPCRAPPGLECSGH